MQDPRYGRHRRDYRRGRSSSISPLDYNDRDDLGRGYSSGDDSSDYERDRGYSRYRGSPTLTSSYIASPSIAPASIAGDGYSRRRASSFYSGRSNVGTPYIPPMDVSAPSTSLGGAIIIPPPASSVGGYYPASSYGGSAFGTSYDYRDANGRKVHRTTHGDPTSEYSHLPPGTYMITGGSSSGRHHRRHRRYS